VRCDERATGRVGVAVYPWEVTIGPPSPSNGAINAITAPISALAPEGGRMRVRVGPLMAEGPRDELERLGLRRGEPARASFSAADVRLLALDGE
jgi:molybdate transport system ATP-binding protein